MFDQAGVVVTEDYDFKGNVLASSRRLTLAYERVRDWSSPVELDADVYARSGAFDALNRPIAITMPDASVIRPRYNEANLPDGVDVHLRGAVAATPFVTNVEYNARGQRIATEHGNGVRCEYDHDPATFRLRRLLTTRGSDGAVLQDLQYTYDPTGNITHLADSAQQTIYFANQVVSPASDYVYDALYRLVSATGREHVGQVSRPETTWDDPFRTHLAHPHDGQAMRRYAEAYDYDLAGNIEQLSHSAGGTSWTRAYGYAEASQLEAGQVSNRLSTATVGSTAETFGYDAHGNTVSVPHLSTLEWNFLDQLAATSRQIVSGGNAETTFNVYDATGQRVRKVTQRANGTRKSERRYLGDFEVHREYGVDGTDVTLERETLHVGLDRRVALVETRTRGDDPGPAQLVRYQHANHLGSASLELDDRGQVISYEEYYPYGSTSYQAARSETETPKRYRYTGMERDEESGFAYHRARYYMPWLGKWLSADPIGIGGGSNLYEYARGNPVALIDPHGTDSKSAAVARENRTIARLKRQYAANQKEIEQLNAALKDAEAAQANVQRLEAEWKTIQSKIDKQLDRLITAEATYKRAVDDAKGFQRDAERHRQRANRLRGGLKAAGGIAEMAAGCPVAATGIGAFACIHGMDNVRSGGSDMLTGGSTRTATEQTLTSAAGTFLPKDRAEQAAQLIDSILTARLSMRTMSAGAGADESYALAPSRRQSGATTLASSDNVGAELVYDQIRADTTDVAKIAANTGFAAKYIQKIKNHVFYQDHLLDRYADYGVPPEMRRFDASPEMANSWLRLTEGEFLKIDVDLLKHELAEAWYMKQHGPSYKSAHDKAAVKHPSPY